MDQAIEQLLAREAAAGQQPGDRDRERQADDQVPAADPKGEPQRLQLARGQDTPARSLEHAEAETLEDRRRGLGVKDVDQRGRVRVRAVGDDRDRVDDLRKGFLAGNSPTTFTLSSATASER